MDMEGIISGGRHCPFLVQAVLQEQTQRKIPYYSSVWPNTGIGLALKEKLTCYVLDDSLQFQADCKDFIC